MVETVTVGMVSGTFLTKAKPGVGNNTQRNRKPQEKETLVFGDDPWKMLCMHHVQENASV